MIIDPDFLDHWKVRMLADLLGDEMAPLYLMRLWSHCQNRRADSFELPDAAVKAICKFPGEAAALISSLETAGFLSSEGNRRTMVGWLEKNASLVAAWGNGALGGRPRKPTGYPIENPSDNPPQTEGEPTEKRAEQSRAEQIGEEQNLSAAARAAAEVDFFKGLDLEAVAMQAGKLSKSIPEHQKQNTNRDYVWQVCAIAQGIDGGLIGEIVTRIKAGSIRNPKSYIDKTLRDECAKRNHEFAKLREHCPATPPPPNPKPPPAEHVPAVGFRRVPKPENGIRALT